MRLQTIHRARSAVSLLHAPPRQKQRQRAVAVRGIGAVKFSLFCYCQGLATAEMRGMLAAVPAEMFAPCHNFDPGVSILLLDVLYSTYGQSA